MEKELQYLMGAVDNPVRPMACIVGGAKVSSKVKKRADTAVVPFASNAQVRSAHCSPPHVVDIRMHLTGERVVAAAQGVDQELSSSRSPLSLAKK